MNPIRLFLVLIAFVLGGCMSTENPNLLKPIADISMAEVVGSKIKSTGSIPHRVWPVTIDGKNSPMSGYPWDMIFPLKGGPHRIMVQYEGAVMAFLGTLPKNFSAQKEFILETTANVRYITRGKYLGGKAALWIEEHPSGKIVSPEVIVPVTWIDIQVRLY